MSRISSILLGLLVLLATGALVVWFIWKTAQKSEDPGRVLMKWVATAAIFIMLMIVGAGSGMADFGSAFILPITAAVFGVVLGILWAPHLGALLAKPLTSFYDGGDAEVEERPFYSIARARQKQGRHPEAIAEVRKQLDRFPEDFEGWMLLADINATHLKDNAAAQDCVNEILSHKGHAPKNIAFALSCSADWHLRLAADREAAGEALERIIQLFPDTELAHSAAQRLAHLTTDQMLAEQKDRPIIALPRHDEKIGLAGKVATPELKTEAPEAAAARLVAHLDFHPMDVEAREQLAHIYAEHYHRMELAADQLEQLIAAPGVAPKQAVRWINLLADFHINLAADRPSAEGALKRIMELYPNTAAAANAEKRIAYLGHELRKSHTPANVHLGKYEENIGLTGNVPKRPG
jgi:tetratricopeptide (TPR) repeat protein